MATKKDKNSDSVADRLSDLLQKKDLTKADFARKIGVSNAHVANWLNGQLPRADQLLMISNFLEVTMEWLLTGRGAPTINETIEGADAYMTSMGGPAMTQEQRAGARRILEKRQLAYQPDKILMMLAETEDRLSAAEKEVSRLVAKLEAARKALE